MTERAKRNSVRLGTIIAVVGVVASAFTAGMAFKGTYDHASVESIHETADQKNKRFDERFALRSAPLFQHNEACSVQFNKLDTKLDDIRDYLMKERRP